MWMFSIKWVIIMNINDISKCPVPTTCHSQLTNDTIRWNGKQIARHALDGARSEYRSRETKKMIARRGCVVAAAMQLGPNHCVIDDKRRRADLLAQTMLMKRDSADAERVMYVCLVGSTTHTRLVYRQTRPGCTPVDRRPYIIYILTSLVLSDNSP